MIRLVFFQLLTVLMLGISTQTASAGDPQQTYGPVQPHDKLWNIARQAYADEEVSIEQGMLVILKANPDAFSSPCNMASYLKQGKTLIIPSAAQARKLPRDTAKQAYIDQVSAWQTYLSAGKTPVCPPAPPEAVQAEQQQTAAPPPDVKTMTDSPAAPSAQVQQATPPAAVKTTAPETRTEPAAETVSPHPPQQHDTPLTYTRLHQLIKAQDPPLTPRQEKTLLQNAIDEHDLLALAWAAALALSLIIYLVLDGADLGAGVIALYFRDAQTREAIMASMAGTWDANETWLVVAGGILFGGFPFVYGSVFHYLLLPLLVTLLAIMLRATALEYTHHADSSRVFWGWGFGIGSLLVAFSLGLAGGAVLQGVPMTTVPIHYAGGGTLQTFTGGLFDFLSGFSLWTGLVGVITALLAGSLYLRARFHRDSPLRQQLRPWVTGSYYLFILALLITAVWGYFRLPWVADKLNSGHAWLWLLPLLWISYLLRRLFNAYRSEKDMAAMAWFAGLIASVLGLIALMLYPWLVPGSWTIYTAADPSLSLVSFTIAMGGFIPVILVYNWYQLWVFRSRMSLLGTYH